MGGRCLIRLSGPLVSLALLFLFFARSGRAEEALIPETPDCSAQATTFIVEKLKLWQQRLKLDNWKITVTMSHLTDLKPKTLGNIHWEADNKTASIRVLYPSDYQVSCGEALKDIEFTIVHELIHLELSSLPRSDASRREEEHAVNQLTQALLELDRRK